MKIQGNNIFASVLKLFLNQFAQRILQTGLAEVTASVVFTSYDTTNPNTILTGAHGAKEGYIIRWLTGALAGHEQSVLSVPDATHLVVDYNFNPSHSSLYPTNGDTFGVFKGVSAQYDATGSLSVSVTPLEIIDLPDASGGYLATATTNIPASSGNPTTLVASLAARCRKIKWTDDIGGFIGIYTGVALSEVLHTVVGPGGKEIEVDIPAGTRISIRNMANTIISSTNFAAIDFLG